MTVGSRDKTRVINVSVSRRNEEVLNLVEEFADGKGMSRSDSLFYLSERMLNQTIKTKGGLQWHQLEFPPSVERLINDALKKLPVSQTREQFMEDAVSRYVSDLRRKSYRLKWHWFRWMTEFP